MLRYDVVGCGTGVQELHGPVIRHLIAQRAATVNTCYDSNLKTAQRAAQLLGAAHAATPSEMGNFEAADAAIIATPPESHAAVARRYLAAGKHVFVEKPFVARSDEARDLIELA